MLYKNSVDPSTFSLLRELQQRPALKSCPLAGGTALALQLGHRISADLDFFSPKNIDLSEVKRIFESYRGAMELEATKGSGNERGFYEFYTLLKKFRLSQMLTFNKAKFKKSNLFTAVKSLRYYDDAGTDPAIPMPKGLPEASWESIKRGIEQKTKSI